MSKTIKMKFKGESNSNNLIVPSDWKVVRLSEISTIRFSNVDKKSYPNEFDVKLCNYMDVYTNEYITNALSFMEATAKAAEVERFKVEEGDVIVTKDSETPDDIGVPAVVVEEIPNLVCGYHLAQIKPNPAIVESAFLAKQISHERVSRYFARLASGSTRYGLTTNSFDELEVWLPIYPEQRKIAKILTTVDGLIEKTEAVIAKLESVKQGMMQDLFTRGVDKNGELRPPYEEAPEFYKETKLGWIPTEWDVKSIQESARVIDSLHRTPVFSDDGYAMVRVVDIKGGILNLTNCARVAPNIYDEFTHHHQPHSGDIVLSRVGSYGISGYADTDEPFCMGQNTVVITDHANSRFLFEYLQTTIAKSQFDLAVAGSSQKTLSLKAIKESLVPTPPDPERELITDQISAISKEISMEQSFLKKNIKLKTGLMQDLLTGKVRVKVDDAA